MALQDFYKAIDYYLANASNSSSLVVSVIALLISLGALCLSIYTFKKHYRETIYNYLAEVWNDVIDVCHQNPLYLDITKTENYQRLMEPDEKYKYDIYCYKAWGHVEDIISKEFDTDKQFEPIIHWVISYHYNWLIQNPTFFTIDRFWDVIEKVRKTPHLIFRYRKLPIKNGDIDWDIISSNYHSYILGPFAEEMVLPKKSGDTRNLVLNYLRTIPDDDLIEMNIADFGCGPGNLIPHIAGRVKKLTGVDKSKRALEIAEQCAREHQIGFNSHCVDFCEMNLNECFDYIICINAILPNKRQDIILILEKIRQHLKPTGKLLAILPSFDTTEHLRNLWHQHYVNLFGNTTHADRIVRAFNKIKLVDPENHAYADDGNTIQCYHTKDTIISEFSAAGLKLINEPEKVRYPWELTKRFDYGYFPEVEEEIWDWFVVAERSSTT